MACVGNESRLVDCQYTAIHNCLHSEDAGISCKAECEFKWFTYIELCVTLNLFVPGMHKLQREVGMYVTR